MARLRKSRHTPKPRVSKPRSSARKKTTGRFNWALTRRIVLLGLGTLCLCAIIWGIYTLLNAGYITQTRETIHQSLNLKAQDLGFKIKKITVEGRVRTSLHDIDRVLNTYRGHALPFQDLKAMSDDIARLPWVKDVTLQRILPDRLHIRLTERTPLALWQAGNRVFLIDSEGAIIPHQEIEAFSHLLMLQGAGANEAASELLMILASDEALKERIVTGIRVGKRRWNLLLDNGIFVNLPEEDPQKAFADLSKLNKQYDLLKQDIRVIDMRLADRLILELEEKQKNKTNNRI